MRDEGGRENLTCLQDLGQFFFLIIIRDKDLLYVIMDAWTVLFLIIILIDKDLL